MAADLAPGFLVAAPSLLDPNFAQSVVLLVDHRAEGSLGFVVNRPATINFQSVVAELGLSVNAGGPPSVPVLIGGPVSPHTGWLVYSPRARRRGVRGRRDLGERSHPRQRIAGAPRAFGEAGLGGPPSPRPRVRRVGGRAAGRGDPAGSLDPRRPR
ncbi:MAG: YqgE/AlgH family protein [Myxococcales bacterium]|nr:YqgE/AlgH family protein [Myxococcales bacterium]